MEKNRLLTAILAIVLCIGLSLGLCACGEPEDTAPTVDYSKDNAYAVVKTDGEDALAFAPDGVKAEYGVIFYVGTVIPPEMYTYLGEGLAAQGYVVVMPKCDMNMTYMDYRETEVAYDNYPDVKFFLSGHSQGGGTAVRRAEENADKTVGVVLYSPLCYSRDELDENGDEISIPDSIADAAFPVMLFEASEDHVLTDAMKATAKTRIPENHQYYMIEGGCHMSYSTFDDDEILDTFNDGPLKGITREEQRAIVLSKTLEFLKTAVSEA